MEHESSFRVTREESRDIASKKVSPLSLSDFLQKKLNGSSELPRAVKVLFLFVSPIFF